MPQINVLQYCDKWVKAIEGRAIVFLTDPMAPGEVYASFREPEPRPGVEGESFGVYAKSFPAAGLAIVQESIQREIEKKNPGGN